MGLLGGLFGTSNREGGKERKSIPWIPLTTMEQLAEIEERSQQRTQLIFKHSTTCGISRMVMNMFTDSYEFTESEIDPYYLDLHAYRDISNEVGYRFQVMHQSPQLLVIRNGTVVSHASHGAITEVELSKYL